MKIKDHLPKIFVLGFFGLGAIVLVSKNLQSRPAVKLDTNVSVVQTELSTHAQIGAALYASSCVACHGRSGSGSDKGPPLVHEIYNPGHHPDEAFYEAVANGVPQHHWPYGNMPRQRQVSKAEVAQIIQYIRELQVAQGITYRPHRM